MSVNVRALLKHLNSLSRHERMCRMRRALDVLDVYPNETDMPHSTEIYRRIAICNESISDIMRLIKFKDTGDHLSSNFGPEWGKVYLVRCLINEGYNDDIRRVLLNVFHNRRDLHKLEWAMLRILEGDI